MQNIISFFIRNRYTLLFLFLQIIAILFTFQSHSYHKSKFINSANLVTGSIYNKFNVFENYYNLKEYNNQLATENNKLKNLLTQKNGHLKSRTSNVIDSLVYHQNYTYINAKVINNNYTKSNNFLTINKGKKDSVFSDLGVINSKGVIGIIANSSTKYATAISIINENIKINARLKKNIHFGTITWNGNDYKTVQFEDLPRQANIKIGDTIITDGKSTIFPEGILIGSVKNFKLTNNNYKQININLFNDMSAIKHVNIVLNLDKTEINKLEQKNE